MRWSLFFSFLGGRHSAMTEKDALTLAKLVSYHKDGWKKRLVSVKQHID